MDYSNFTIFYVDFLYLKLIFDYRFFIFCCVWGNFMV